MPIRPFSRSMGNQYGRTQNYLASGPSSQADQYTSNVSGSPTAGPQAHFFGLAMPPKPNVPGVSNSYRKQGLGGYGGGDALSNHMIQRAIQMSGLSGGVSPAGLAGYGLLTPGMGHEQDYKSNLESANNRLQATKTLTNKLQSLNSQASKRISDMRKAEPQPSAQTNYLSQMNDMREQQGMAAASGSVGYQQGLAGSGSLSGPVPGLMGDTDFAGAQKRNENRIFAGSSPGGQQMIDRFSRLAALRGQDSRSPAQQDTAAHIQAGKDALSSGFHEGSNLYNRDTGEQVRMAQNGFPVVQRGDGSFALTTSSRRPMTESDVSQNAQNRQDHLQDPAVQKRGLAALQKTGRMTSAAEAGLAAKGIEPKDYLNDQGKVDKAKLAKIIKRESNSLAKSAAVKGYDGTFDPKTQQAGVDQLNQLATTDSPEGAILNSVGVTAQSSAKDVHSAMIDPSFRATYDMGSPELKSRSAKAFAMQIQGNYRRQGDSWLGGAQSESIGFSQQSREAFRVAMESSASLDLTNESVVNSWFQKFMDSQAPAVESRSGSASDTFRNFTQTVN